MSMMWIKQQSKWFVIGAALLIGAGLIMMDLPGANGRSVSGQAVGEVDGDEITTMSFQQDLQNYVRSEEARSGKAPEGGQLAQIRQNLFLYKVQNMLVQRLVKNYAFHASREEMLDYVTRNPREVAFSIAQYEGAEALPPFLRDSTLDARAYRGWLTQDSVYDRPGMRMLEEQLRTTVIPQLQLQQVFRSQVHRTDLEESFRVESREDQGRLQFYRVSADAFPVDAGKLSEADLKAHFESLPDSFYAPTEAARLAYVRLPLVPSPADTVLMRDFAQELHDRAAGGESFEDLARSYSSDPGSAETGGKLPAASRDEWVPEFANAAFALAPGAISQPVLTPYGYHIILMRSITGGKAEVSHILLKITTGTETTDSLTTIAEKLKDEAEDKGFEVAAKARGLAVEKTPVFPKGTLSPLGTTYVQGAASFAFSPAERKAKVSEALQNDEAIYVFGRDAMYPKGRDFDRSRDAVRQSLVHARQIEAARKEAESVRARIVSANPLPATVGKAGLDTTTLITGETYVPGFGFGGPAVSRALHGELNVWSPVVTTSEGAVIARVTEKQPVSAPLKMQKIMGARAEGDNFQVSGLYQVWMGDMPKSAKVENDLDQVYRN